MIISDEHRYLFVELPWTASTAISNELRNYYDGRSILRKHSNYHEFLRFANAEQKSYFTFSGIRHPLDELVSLYVKLRTNLHNTYTNPEWWVSRRKIRQYEWIQERQASFPEFVKRFYWLPAETWSSLDHEEFDYVYRFETVASDFEAILEQLGLEQVRPLPVLNPTPEKGSWQDYYTPEIYDRVRVVFGPRMARWGYEFPPEWDLRPAPQWANLLYAARAASKNLARRTLAYMRPDRS